MLLAVLWALSLVVFMFSHVLGIGSYSPNLVLVSFLFVFTFNPFKICYYRARVWLLRVLVSVLYCLCSLRICPTSMFFIKLTGIKHVCRFSYIFVACVAGGILEYLQRLRRQISLDYYTLPPATQANIFVMSWSVSHMQQCSRERLCASK